ncbi:unnamed protein product [Macrosiphum euphorbiae]|uniref:Uncharacterized protein n=1 Tax=Macrosiphum euphorbiae TaxID=13131 RepID=A0AAV0W9T2_9HEMI|nr:unnamed protein product [Macrosiphum euphorbiae]
MAEIRLLSKYLYYLHQDIHTCASVRSNFITEAEANLLNFINQKHAKCLYGKELFFAGKDYIVHLRDVLEFNTFLEVCCAKLMYNITPGGKEKCGFIRINNFEPAVPYCVKDYQKYVPLFCFEGLTENQKQRAIKLENWNLAYLKFCLKIKCMMRNEFYASESCTVISLDDIKNNFPPETNFEEYWPAHLADTYVFLNKKFKSVNPQAGAWIRAPLEVVPAENTIAHTLTAPSPLPPSMPVMTNTYQNGLPANQMV